MISPHFLFRITYYIAERLRTSSVLGVLPSAHPECARSGIQFFTKSSDNRQDVANPPSTRLERGKVSGGAVSTTHRPKTLRGGPWRPLPSSLPLYVFARRHRYAFNARWGKGAAFPSTRIVRVADARARAHVPRTALRRHDARTSRR